MDNAIRLPTLGFHHISYSIDYYTAIKPDFFDELIQELGRNYRFLSLAEIWTAWQNKIQLPENGLLLTFDDAYEDIYQPLLTAVQKHQTKGVIFVITDYVGKKNDWNTKAPYTVPHLTEKQLKTLSQNGYELGSHTCSHHNLLKYNTHQLANELTKSQTALATQYNQPVRAISYPYGFWNQPIKSCVAPYYTFGFSTQTKTDTTNWSSDPYTIKRIMVTNRTTIATIKEQIHQYKLGEAF
jgi:peptidoglycan/xylan/chitin deacetylase (PgdA/CDA1 family)